MMWHDVIQDLLLIVLAGWVCYLIIKKQDRP